MDKDDLEYLQAYSDGVNDFVDGITMFGKEKTALAFPPEFWVAGITKFEPWTPADSLAILKLMNFHLSWSWKLDLMREYIDELHPELKDLVEELAPFTSEFSVNLVTLLNNEEAK